MTDKFDSIPDELKAYHQWVCWKFEIRNGKPTKVPLNPRDGTYASVTDADTWGLFSQCVDVARTYTGIGIGFVFTPNDPFGGIDLDNPEDKGKINGEATAIYQMGNALISDFNSYTEFSPSNKGLHIIFKSGLPPDGRRSSKYCIELYTTNRFFTFTGNSFHKEPLPIVEADEIAYKVYDALKTVDKKVDEVPSQPASKTPQELIDFILSWSNGDMFRKQMNMEFNLPNVDDNAIDQGVMNFIVQAQKNYECVNFDLAAQTFKATQRGNRDKANRKDYIERTFVKAYDQMVSGDYDVNFSTLLANGEAELRRKYEVNAAIELIKANPEPAQPIESHVVLKDMGAYVKPPGLIGRIADFIYEAAPFPVPEIALCAAIGLMAGIAGRSFNVEGNGLNVYLMLLAKTGRGKEAMNSGINKLLAACQRTPPRNGRLGALPNFAAMLGPGSVRSAPALLKTLNDHPCFVSIFGEFAYDLGNMNAVKAQSNATELKSIYLNIYGKSSHGNVFKGSVYSDAAKNIPPIAAPAFSIIGESVPKEIYQLLDERMIESGLLNRFTFFEYTGLVPDFNKQAGSIVPSKELIYDVIDLASAAKMLSDSNQVNIVKMTPEADAMFDELMYRQSAMINRDVLTSGLWSRTALKAKKLAALVAVGINYQSPVIDADCANWGIQLALADVKLVESKFDNGEAGAHSEESEQFKLIKRQIKIYLTNQFDKLGIIPGNQDNLREMHFKQLIPRSYLHNKLHTHAAFRGQYGKGNEAFERAIAQMLKNGELIQQTGVKMSNGSTSAMLVYSIDPSLIK